MLYDDNNIFAKILRKQLPAEIVFEDELSMAFVDLMPQNDGHTLVIPKSAAVDLTDIDSDILCHLIKRVQILAPLICSAVGKDGFQIRQFNGSSAGQTIFHFHFHIIPVSKGDILIEASTKMQDKNIITSNAEKIRTKIREAHIQ